MIWLLAAYALDRVQLKLTANAYQASPYRSGYGAIDLINSKTAFSPMAYRVLVPWLIALIIRIFPKLRRHRFSFLYEPMKIALMAFAFWASSLVLGTASALLIAVLCCLTFWTDYWDIYVEIASLSLALTGRPDLALLGVILLSLSRETAPLVGVTYFFVTWDLGTALQLIGVSLAILLAVRLYVGKKELYCQRWFIKMNLKEIKEMFDNHPWYMGEITITMIITVLTLIAVFFFRVAFPIPLILLAAGWSMARAPETRVFSSCFIWIAGWLA